MDTIARETVDHPREIAADPQAVAADPVLSARIAGLRYVADDRPGIRRRRRGSGFSYRGPDGRPVGDPAERRRIAALAIPPAWTEVWICPLPNGHLQATGRDARGRKQYRYHPDWRQVRDETKFGRMIAFGEALPRLRALIESDLGRPGLPREKVLAAVVRLLATTLIRVGNQEYARDNRSFGLTTLRSRHVAIAGATLRFHFRGKSGKERDVAISDRRLARVVRACRELPGHELFQYVDESGKRQAVDSDDVNSYLRAATGEDFTAKDFRTWGGTVLALSALLQAGQDAADRTRAVERDAGDASGAGDAANDAAGRARERGAARGARRHGVANDAAGRAREANRLVVEAVKRVAEQLGNRPATCRKYYVHPAIIAAFLEGRLPASAPAPAPAAGSLRDRLQGGGGEEGRAPDGPAASGRRGLPGLPGLAELEAMTLELLRRLPAVEEPRRPARRVRRAHLARPARRRQAQKKGAPRTRPERRRRPRE